MTIASALVALMALAGSAHAQTVIYDTFNENDQADLFDCCHGLAVQGPGTGSEQYVAIPFTPPDDGRLSSVDLALAHQSGSPKTLIFGVYADKNGRPKDMLLEAAVTPPRHFDQCCRFVSVSGQELALIGGRQYWIVMEARKSAVGEWNDNAYGAMGGVASRTEGSGGWQVTDATLPAARIWLLQ